MLAKIINWFNWLKVHIKIIAFSVGLGVVMIFCGWFVYRGKKLKALEQKIAVLAASLQLEQTRVQYNHSLEDLKKLRDTDAAINESLTAIEKSLKERLSPTMTAEEIVKKFKEIGL